MYIIVKYYTGTDYIDIIGACKDITIARRYVDKLKSEQDLYDKVYSRYAMRETHLITEDDL